MGYALGYAATRLREKPECLFKTIDVAGDGKNNDGFRGPSAFVEVAEGFDDYEETMRRKLVRELLSQMIGQNWTGALLPKG